MAIRFARIEFVKRSSGKNSCAKAAYISRSKVEFYGNCISKPCSYDWSHLGSPTFHEVLLPKNVDQKFKNLTTLWNAAEEKEVRSNAQVAMELVLALPDDQMITVEDRIHLTKTFVQEHFVDKGLAAEIAIHPPERRFFVTGSNTELGLKKGMIGHVVSKTDDQMTVKFESGEIISFSPKDFTGFIEKEHNWHAHVLLPTRRFHENGLELDKKARDMMPRVNLGRVVSGPDWGKLWESHQNRYFQERGLELQVDVRGIVPQEHLGPYRMRARAFSLMEEHHQRIEKNHVEATHPEKILTAITSHKSVFTQADLEHFLSKHTPTGSLETVTKEFWQLSEIVQLVDKKTGELIPKYTSQTVIAEEQQILRLAERLTSKEAHSIKTKHTQTLTGLNSEQQEAYHQILQGKRLSMVQGYAGTGKSHLLKALQGTYEKAGYQVRAFGPDNATTDVLRDKGLSHTENVYRFLFAVHHNRRKVLNGKEVWILDETGKLGNTPLLEFLKEAHKHNAQVVLAGDSAQLPPVERGGMFKALCSQYGSQQLVDIQRQKNIQQRDMAKNLAAGDYGAAIDKLSNTKGLIWTENKKEAMEALVLRWAHDTKAFPKSTTLIIAHSNDEVRVLNEMVRLIRRQRGELGEKEFQCTTARGKIFVSIGDRLEFRSNNSSIGVHNGLSGVVVEAEKNRFVVAIEGNGKKKQTVVFNPEEYHSYQLGYASTHYRSQGQTIDRAYVLHSSMLNKQMFYVGLTRHVRDVSYFLSKDEVYCLADLKRLSTRSAEKDLTVEFTTQATLNAYRGAEQRQQQIQDLMGSASVLTRMKGFGLSAWDKVVSKTTDIKDHFQDKRPNESFYQPVIAIGDKNRYPVVEISEITHLNDNTDQGNLMTHPHDETSTNAEYKQPNWDRQANSKAINKLNPELAAQFKDYFAKSEKTSTLKMMVDLEAESASKDIRITSYYQQWQESCGERNKEAFSVLRRLSEGEKSTLYPKMLAIVEKQAQRYESFLAKQDRTSKPGLEDQLKENLEPLLYRLYPDGPTGRDRINFRFGSKGSLSVAHSGTKAGQFYDFEQQTGGGLLKLIQREMGVGPSEARTWAQNFLAIPSEVSIPTSFAKPDRNCKAEDTWISMKPSVDVPAPALDKLGGNKLAHYFDEVSRHPYRDAEGQLLYYVLRLHDKQDPKKKMTPPLSYGYWKSRPEKIGWELKGYRSEQNSLYNLHLLKQSPKSTVLIVEGEKTADLALNKLTGEDYICLTWPGGAGAVSRADWTPLAGRNVLVWPDNDPAGYQAGERVCQELRKVGVSSLHLVNTSELKKQFPEKWDLADKLPEGMSEQSLKKLVAKADQKGINPEQVMIRLSIDPNNTLDRTRINEILWRVDERLRPELEEKYGNQPWKIQDEILRETQRIFLNQSKQKIAFRDKFGMDSVALDSLTYQVCLVQAKQGRDLRLGEVDIIKETIQKHGYVPMPKAAGKEATLVLADRVLNKDCERALSGMVSKDHTYAKSQEGITVSLERIERQRVQMNPTLASTKQQEIVKDNGFGIKL